MEAYILDIGATKIDCLVIQNGVCKHLHFDTPTTQNYFEDLNCLTDFLGINKRTSFVVVSFPGLIIDGYVQKWPNKNYWEGHPIIKDLERIFKTKSIHVIEDCNAGALSSLHIFKGCNDSLFINVGTGIGMGILINGQLYKGQNGYSGEFGHVTVDYFSNQMCNCGRKGCLQLVASGGGMQSLYQKQVKSTSDDTWMEQLFGIDIVKQGAIYLGKSIANTINLLDITNIHLSGSVLKNITYRDLLVEQLREEERVFLKRNLSIAITPQTNASLLGACVYAISELEIPLQIKENIFNHFSTRDFKMY